MKIYLAAIMARQVEGEHVFLKIEKASLSKAKVETFLQSLPTSEAYVVEGFPCVGERSLLDIEVEE